MVLITNTTAASIAAQTENIWGAADKENGNRRILEQAGQMVTFIPGNLTQVEDSVFKELSKTPLIKRNLADGGLVKGAAATKVAANAKVQTKEAEALDAKKKKQQEADDEDLLK